MLDVVATGAGWVTGHRHIPAVKRSGRARVLGVIDSHPDRAVDAARRHRLPHSGDTLNAPWAERATAFTVGVSPAAHFDTVSALLDRGKHVLMEKPMCLTVADGERLARQAKEKGLTLAVVHNFQFARSVRRVQDWLATGRWGRVTGLQAFQWSSPARRLPSWYETLPLGLFYDESPHLLYLLRAFGGPLTLRRASMVRSAAGRVTPHQIVAEFDAGPLPATLLMNFEAPVSEWQLVVMAEGGLAVIDLFRDIAVFVPHDGRHEARNVVRSSAGLVGGHLRGFLASGLRLVSGRLLYGNQEVVRRFFDAIEGVAPLRDIAPDDALDVLRAQHAILDAVGR
jgi:scyllo-inositol 2-dehydrogenase (NADP+)